MITSRTKKIIGIILKTQSYITVSEIASSISVSTRTVLRELDDVTKWIDQNGGTLLKKKGKGILLVEGESSRTQLSELLYEIKSEVVYSPDDRGVILRAKLLQFDEPTKLYSLTRLLKVTESTIGNDLDQLEPWFFNYNIQVIKKPGLGITLIGNEKAKRKAIVALIYEHFHMVELIEVISKNKNKKQDIPKLENKLNKAILDLLNIDVLDEIRDLIVAIEQEMGYQYADNGYIALAIRFSVTLKREKFWGQITLDEIDLEKLKKDRIFIFLKSYLDKYEEHSLNRLPEVELLYLSMHIKGTKLRETGDYNKISMIEDFKVIQLVKEFIIATERETGIYLTDNEQLVIGLVKHLRPALYRLKMDLDIINPLVEEIQQMYPKLFKAIRRSVSVIEDKEFIEVPDDEVAYLATHVGAVIHKNNRDTSSTYKAVVACMYGIGASSFLMAQLKKNFPNISVIQVVSVMDQEIQNLNIDEIDLLISTVPLEQVHVPWVLINPILKDEDINKINTLLRALIPSTSYHKLSFQKHLKERLLSLNEYSRIILLLLDNYHYVKLDNLSSMKHLIKYVSGSIASNEDEYMSLQKAFVLREEKGSTILSKKGMMLLHCRANIQKEVSIQIIQLENSMFMDQENGKVPVDTIVVMVAPVTLNQKILDVFSEISRSIISENLSDTIKSKKMENIESEFNLVLDKYYQKLVLNLE